MKDLMTTAAILAGFVIVLFAKPPAPNSARDALVSLSDTLQSRPLRFLMVGLGQDMNRINDGIWHEDYEMIREGARSVANHPRVTPDEMAAITAALDEQFEAFVGLDRLVHSTAVEIADNATQRSMGRILEQYGKLQQGCVSCHTAFRDRVRKALF